jgi:hypothetical protein
MLVTSQVKGQLKEDTILDFHLQSKVHLLYEQGYVINYVGNRTEEKPTVSMFEFPTGT